MQINSNEGKMVKKSNLMNKPDSETDAKLRSWQSNKTQKFQSASRTQEQHQKT